MYQKEMYLLLLELATNCLGATVPYFLMLPLYDINLEPQMRFYVLPFMGWKILPLSKSTNFLSHQLSHLTTIPNIHLAMATKPTQLIYNVTSII